jgi:hypothetical protein
MASGPPNDTYRGVSEPGVDLSYPEIPKLRTPWFVVVLSVFALATIVGVAVGFWRAASPVPAVDDAAKPAPR